MDLVPKTSLYFQTIIFISCLSFILGYGYDAYDDVAGPYCERRGCCTQRQDNCSLPILTTLCYCDEFCDRSRGGDCCPDYNRFCQKIPEPITTCLYKNRHYRPFETFQDNCNTCTCNPNGSINCERDICIQDDAVINNINSISHTLGWTARNYSEFWGRKYKDGLSLRLGTLEPTYRSKAMTRLTTRTQSLPKEFNAMNYWPNLISEIKDQGWCGSSWVLSTTAVASDRFAIQSKGKEIVQLSPQHILSCARRQRGCNGGHLDAAWRFLNKRGVVDENCYPYTQNVNKCRITHKQNTLQSAGCALPQKVDRNHFYTMGPAYSLNNETDIMHEIELSGPVQATMRVYRDFFSYSGGIYRHSAASRDSEYGFHSVRLVGWGEEHDYGKVVRYWIAANTWGTWWGENGFFRIVRGDNECMIEDYVLAAWPHVYNPYGKRVRN